MRLRQLQALFSDVLFNQSLSYELESAFQHYDRDELDARLKIYRNNVFASLRDCLKEIYPCIYKALGDDKFLSLARNYIHEHPPQTAVMVAFGSGFADFLNKKLNSSSAAQLPVYLIDLARLEWLQHQAYYAADSASLTAAELSSIAPSKLADSHFSLQPSCALLESEFSVFNIWQDLTGGHSLTDGTAVISNGSFSKSNERDTRQSILVVRPQLEVHTYLLEPGMHAALSALQQQASLGEALTAASETPTFNPASAVAFLVQSGALTKVTPTP